MNNNHLFQKQQRSFMFSNLIAFALIFLVFALIIFSFVQNTLFSQVDKELTSFKERMEQNSNSLMPRKNPSDDIPPMREKNPINPRIIVLKWNKEGEIVNQEQMGSLFYINYKDDIIFKRDSLNVITNIRIEDTYHYRSLLFKNEDNSYSQLLINVDSEQSIIVNFEKILFICSVVALLLSITASFILSRKSMKPILRSWKRQSDFVENASHELRTPLTIIQNKLELLLTTPNERIVDKFENIALSLSETRRLSKLTTDLLTLARADSAETQLEIEKVNIDYLVQNICSPYMEIAELQGKSIELDAQAQTEVKVDKNRMHQLLIILLDNALKYTEEQDSIMIRSAVEEQKIVINISDTGIGINKSEQQHIFDRFYRADHSRGRDSGGAGLGLSIAQWIVASHRGTIKVNSDGISGTTFTIKLPIEQ